MPYNETLAIKIENNLLEKGIVFTSKKMFGGMAFMINDKMCVGIVGEQLMLRVMEEQYENLLEENGVEPMNFTGKIMKGFLFISPEVFQTETQLHKWIEFGLEFAEKGVVKSKKKK